MAVSTIALTAGVAGATDSASTCPSPAPRTVRITGEQAVKYRNRAVGTGTTIDATGARWTGVGSYPVHLAGGAGACWTGGTITGTYSDSTTWDTLHDTGAFNVFLPGTMVERVRIHNYGDGLRALLGASDFRFRGNHLSYIRDDCVENDKLNAGVVEGSFLDGCYVAFSARPSSTDTVSNGSGKVWAIRNNVVRLQPMPTVYRGPAPGHGGFFKWDSTRRGPQLELHNNVFRADQNSNHTTMGIPPGSLASCSNNIMVWLGTGPYPAPLPSCFTITTDASVWDWFVGVWHSIHSTD